MGLQGRLPTWDVEWIKYPNPCLPARSHIIIFSKYYGRFLVRPAGLEGKSMHFDYRQFLKTSAFAGILGVVAVHAIAHHSIAGEFDSNREFELRGTITGLDWANPHLWYYLDVVNEAGDTESWQCTTGANPNRLVRAGWQKEDLPMGTRVVIARANPAWDDSNTCFVASGLASEDGSPIFRGQKP